MIDLDGQAGGEKRLKNCEERLLADYRENGAAYIMNKRIKKAYIDHPSVARAFEKFIGCAAVDGDCFRLIDVLTASANKKRKKAVYGSVGEKIICFSAAPAGSKLEKMIFNNSVNGFFELINKTNGLYLDLPREYFDGHNFNMDRRFVFANEKKTAKMVSEALKNGVKFDVLGIVFGEKRIIIKNGGETAADLDKSLLENERTDPAEIRIEAEDFKIYTDAFFAAIGSKYSISAGLDTVLNLGTGGGLDKTAAAVLGLHNAFSVVGLEALRINFNKENGVAITVKNGGAAPGDNIFLLTPVCAEGGVPVPASYSGLNGYISQIKNSVRIRAVIPVKNDPAAELREILGDMLRLSGDGVEYTASEAPYTSVLIITDGQIKGKYLGRIINR